MPSNLGGIGPTGFAGQPNQFLYVERFEPRLLSQIDWFMPFSEPVRSAFEKSKVQAARQQAFFQPGPLFDSRVLAVNANTPGQIFSKSIQYQAYALPPNPTVPFGWYELFTDPVRVRPRLRSADPFAGMGSFDPIVSFGWYESLVDPVKKKPGLSTSAQLFYTTDPFPIPDPPVVTAYNWFAPLSEPVRKKAALLEANQLPFASNIFPADPTVFGASSTDAGPFFRRTVMYQAYAKSDFTQPLFVPDFGWFMALSDPQKLAKKGISESLQSFSMQGSVLPIIPSYGWYQALSDPKDLKRKGLRTDLQQSLIQGAVPEIYSFRSTGPLYVNHRSGRPATFWKGRTR